MSYSYNSKNLDVLTVPLSGVNLVEASAGTGKTFSLAIMVLRLVIENGWSLKSILVVTYTNAATAELRDRIRIFLLQAKRNAEGKYATNDENLIAELIHNCKYKNDLVALLEKEFLSVDEAPVYTIHSFCQRTLTDHAFASARSFERELITDQTDYLSEIATDFYRNFIIKREGIEVALIDSIKIIGPESIEAFYCNVIKYHGLKLPKLQDSVETIFSGLSSSWKKCKNAWINEQNAIKEWFLSTKLIKANIYRANTTPVWLNKLDMIFEADRYEKKDLLKITKENILSAAKKDKKNEVNSFLSGLRFPELVEQFLADAITIEDNLYGAVLFDAYNYCIKELAVRKNKDGVMGFDDLLSDLYDALTSGSQKNHLIEALRKTYHAAFIDEFQDTDPQQCRIFTTIFAAPKKTFFMIGDPKQSIYRFRGADINAYLATAKQPGLKLWKLSKNFRSSQRVISAFNKLFSTSNPFASKEINYHPISPPQKDAKNNEINFNKKISPSGLIIFHSDMDGTKQVHRQLSYKCVIKMIAKLLQSGAATIDDRALLPKDIAILTRTRKAMGDLKVALNQYGIPSVIASGSNVWESDTAFQLYTLLVAISNPNRANLLRSALITSLVGFSAVEIDAFLQSDINDGWDRIVNVFRDAKKRWVNRGVIASLYIVMDEFETTKNLLCRTDGNRRMTDLRHCIELLREQEDCGSMRSQELLDWFARHLNDPHNSAEQIRLESDANAVIITTVHASKGLQYPIVFFPDGFDDTNSHLENRDLSSPYAISNKNGSFFCELRKTELNNSRKQIKLATLQEDLRLFYVAVTRAKHLCCIYYPANEKFHAKLNDDVYSRASVHIIKPLFEQNNFTDDKQPIQAYDADTFIKDIVMPIDIIKNIDYGSARTFTATVQTRRTVTSYSRLVRHGEIVHYEWGNPTAIHKLPAGRHTGNALHELLEMIDFFDTTNHKLIIEDILTKYALADHTYAVLSMISNLLTSTLSQGTNKFCLCNILPQDRINELTFFMRADSINRNYFKSILGNHIGDITEDNIAGMLTGAIDLIFRYDKRYYIVDWKSNRLGQDSNCYVRPSLEKAMMDHNYHLQYHLYTVALDTYLKNRLKEYQYETHFGGVYYLFLRGFDVVRSMSKKDSAGIFFCRPKAQSIQNLCDILITKVSL